MLSGDGDAAMEARLAAARRAAAFAKRESCERAIMRTETRALETYCDAWARYAQALEDRMPPPSAAPTLGGGQRPFLLPQGALDDDGAPKTGEEICSAIAADLSLSLIHI